MQSQLKFLKTELAGNFRPNIETPSAEVDFLPDDLFEGLDFSGIQDMIDEQDEMFKASQDARKNLFKGTLDFELEQLELQREEYANHHLMTAEAQAIFEQKRLDIVNKFRDKQTSTEIANRNIQASLQQAELTAMKGVVSELETMFNQRMENDIKSLKATEEYQNASLERRQDMENQVMRDHSQAQQAMFMANKVARIAEIMMNTATAVTGLLAIPFGQGIPLIPFVKAMGAVQATIVASAPPPPTFETGGLVGGRRHSQGGTLIEAEQGEFVMSRSAVQAVGLEQMNEINQGGTGGVTVNVTAPLVDETVVDSIIPAIEKATRLNLA